MKVGIITDIHENVEMLTEALRLAGHLKCDELVCLGDITGFDRRFYKNDKRSARACLELVRSNCRWVVAGNHDLHAASRIPSHSDGFIYPGNWFTMSPTERKKLAGGKVWCYEFDEPNDLDPEDIELLNSLPEYIITKIKGINCLFSHYTFPDFTGSTTQYVEKNSQLRSLWDYMKNNKIQISFTGHTHNMFAGFAYRNPGLFLKAIHSVPGNSFNLGNEMVVIGLPPLTGDKGRTGFSIVDFETMKMEIVSTVL